MQDRIHTSPTPHLTPRPHTYRADEPLRGFFWTSTVNILPLLVHGVACVTSIRQGAQEHPHTPTAPAAYTSFLISVSRARALRTRTRRAALGRRGGAGVMLLRRRAGGRSWRLVWQMSVLVGRQFVRPSLRALHVVAVCSLTKLSPITHSLAAPALHLPALFASPRAMPQPVYTLPSLPYARRLLPFTPHVYTIYVYMRHANSLTILVGVCLIW